MTFKDNSGIDKYKFSKHYPLHLHLSTMFEFALSIVLCIFLVCLLKKFINRKYEPIVGIPGPSRFELLSYLFKTVRGKGTVVKNLHSIQDKYGSTFTIHVDGFSPILVTSDHNYFGKILSSKEFVQKPSAYDVLKPVASDSIAFTYNIDMWRNHRKILNDVFGHKSYKVFLENLDQQLHTLDSMILEKIHGPVDMQDVLVEFILHTTIDSLKDPNIEWDRQRTIQYKKSSDMFLTNAVKSHMAQILKLNFFFKLTNSYRTLQKEIKVMRQYGADMVNAHLEAMDKQTHENNIIYRMHKANVPYERIVDNVIIFIEAAHETVATALAFAYFEIAKRPDIQNKMVAEIDGIIESNTNSTISATDIQRMTYIHCVVKEVLRLRPTVPYVMRKLHKPLVVDNVSLPEGTNIVFFIDALHKSEKYYKDPLVFNPDRFTLENQANLVPNTWTPFALGIRNCIGMTLAMQKMKLILAKTVRRFEFSPVVPEHTLDLRDAIMVKSVNGVPVIAKERGNREKH